MTIIGYEPDEGRLNFPHVFNYRVMPGSRVPSEQI